MEISNLPDKELKIMAIYKVTKLRRRMKEHTENLNKEVKNISKNKSGLKNTNQGEKCTTRNQHQIRACRRMVQPFGRQNSGNHPIRTEKKKFLFCLNSSIHPKLVPKAKKREEGTENLFEEIIAENFSNLGKETDIHV